jgi:hypothetical protein
MQTKAFRITYLDPEGTRFKRQGDALSLTTEDGQHYPSVKLRACFPVSEKDKYLAVYDAREKAELEIGILEDWTKLKTDDRQEVASELGVRYLVPKIQRVFDVENEPGFLRWKVETDKGAQEFMMHEGITHYAREVKPGNWLLVDVDEARYEIPDVETMDRKSQKLIRKHLYM